MVICGFFTKRFSVPVYVLLFNGLVKIEIQIIAHTSYTICYCKIEMQLIDTDQYMKISPKENIVCLYDIRKTNADI